MLARARPAWNGRPPEPAAIEMDIDFDRRVAARIENLARVNSADGGRGHIVRELAALAARRNLSFSGNAASRCATSATPNSLRPLVGAVVSRAKDQRRRPQEDQGNLRRSHPS